MECLRTQGLLRKIPMDKLILRKFLKSGFMEKQKLYPTTQGVPQGGSISAALAVMALSGLENQVRSSKHKRQKEKINVVFYADDFIVTAASYEILESKVIPILTEALGKVGLELSTTKTKITQIEDGLDFLGFNIRKYKNGKLLIKPAKANIKRFLKEIKTIIKKGVAQPTEQLIHRLNSRLTGWCNYYRTKVSSKVFSYVDHEIFQALMRWAYKRHARKGKRWIVGKYFTTLRGDHWRFHCKTKDEGASDTKIRRHIKIKSAATPFDPLYKGYFEQREQEKKRRKTISNLAHSTGLRIIQPY